MTAATARFSEFKVIARHAGTVLVGQLAVMAFGVADTLIAGRYSDAALAALSVGSALYISVYVGLIGIIQALLPIWSEMLGAKAHTALGRSMRQSLYLCACIAVPGMAALLLPGPLLQWAQVPQAMQGEVERYLAVLAFAFVPSLLFRLYSTFNQAIGKPLLVTWLQVGALAIKVPLSIWLVRGGAGLAPMGAVGCAWATLVVTALLLLFAVAMLRYQSIYRPFALWRRMERPDWAQIGQFARLGIPGGAAYLVEVTSFTLIALFVARLGTTASGGHQIASSVAAVLYMVPLSVAIACSARVSFWTGAGHPQQAKSAIWAGFMLVVTVSIAFLAIILVANRYVASLYSSNPEIIALGSSLLIWVAFYHVADAVQTLCAFLLRCYRITLVPLALYGVLLWALGLYGGYQLTYAGWSGWPATQSASSFWLASTAAIWLVAVAFSGLLWVAVRASVQGRATAR